MDSDSWLAYMAVKILLESELRRNGRTLEESLGRVRFDGHKGVPLRFVEGRLQQPLYLLRRRGTEEIVETADADA
jgi:hypothetical protein